MGVVFMNNERTYTYYRNLRVPGWWIDYLPEEKNPYKASDTLTLEKGCLSDYWYIHSSNKYPNHRGVEACNFVHSLIRERFGGVFLSNDYYHILGSRAGTLKTYREPEHLVYENAYIGEDGNIHIKNAKKYYDDVIRFVMNVLGEIAKNHMQSGNSYNAREFFPYSTDQQIEKNRIEAERKRVNTIKLKEDLVKQMQGSTFCLKDFVCEKSSFNASYDYEDGWFNVSFFFEGIKTNLDSDMDEIKIIVDFPSMFHADSKKKDRKRATKVLEISFGFYLKRKATKDTYSITIPIAEDKVSEKVKSTIDTLCNTAMDDYNETHLEMIENINCTPIWRYYPYNIFLDNQIGKLKLTYKESAGWDSRRGRYL